MMVLFVKDFLLPSLGLCAVLVVVAVCAAWLGYVINSIARAADALERIADALGTDGDATADAEEAEATGRHFIVESTRDAAAMREAIRIGERVTLTEGGK